MKQTAIEWLYETLWKQTNFSLPNNILEKAKEMEKQQIMNAVYDSMGTNFDANMGRAKLYYDTTFKKD
jgi:phosphoenolpyruvate synthase/pyruvate phosphate dikinase